MKDFKKRFLSVKLPSGYDRYLHLTILILMAFGSIMLFSVVGGSAQEVGDSKIVINAMIRQAIFIIISYYAMCFFARNYFLWARSKHFAILLQIVGVGIIVLLVLTLFTTGIKGSKAWLQIAGFSLQPAELAKVYLIVLLGFNANGFHTRVGAFRYLRLPLVYLTIFTGIILLQPDMGSAMVLLMLFYVCFFVPSNRSITKMQRILILISIVAFALIFFFIFTDGGLSIIEKIFGENSYKAKRFTNAANPFLDKYGTGYNVMYSLFAISRGGLFGVGYGGSVYKYGYLPEAQSDFILAIVIEELGIFGFGLLCLLYGVIIYRLLHHARRIKQDGYRIVLIGTMTYLSIHFIFNVGGISGLIPLTGVPLLFMSSGGTSILAISILLGICQAMVALHNRQHQRPLKEKRIRGKEA
ncbi:MAG: FtsW/RodA/SpoVE family cell cycle protein [Breznakia sp.]